MCARGTAVSMTWHSSGGAINATPSDRLAIGHYACCHHRNLLSLGNAVSDKCIQLEPGVVSVVLAFLLRLTRTLRLLGPPDSDSPEDLTWRQLGVKKTKPEKWPPFLPPRSLCLLPDPEGETLRVEFWSLTRPLDYPG